MTDNLEELVNRNKNLEQKAEEYAKESYKYIVGIHLNDIIKVAKAYKDGYKQGQNDKHQIVCDGCVDYGMLQKENAELKADLQILFNMLNGGDKNEMEQQRIGEMWNLCF